MTRTNSFLESLRCLDLPVAALYFGIFGVVLFLLTFLLAFGAHCLLPKSSIAPWIPVVIMPGCYFGIFVAYGKVHKNTEQHNTSIFGIQLAHAVITTGFVVLALLPNNQIDLRAVMGVGSAILFWYYLNFLGLCLSVWTRPPLMALAFLFVYILMVVLCITRVIA